MQNDIDDLIEAVKTIADTSFDLGSNNIAERPWGSTKKGFYRPGERPDDGAPFTPTTTIPKYNGPPTGRAPSNEEKRGAWQLQEEYLAVPGRLGKNEEENARLWNTVKWINRHYAITKMPAEALPPLNIYIGDKISQSTGGTGAPAGPDDEAPDDEAENEGIEFESINVCQADKSGNTKVMDENGTMRRLDFKIDNYDLIRLVDAIEEIDKMAKIDVNDLIREAPPLLPQIDFPTFDQRAESGKIIRLLMLGMGPLWHPVICAIVDHATMKSLGKSQGVGDDKAATVGRWRVIEGLRLAESIRKGREKRDAVDEASHWPARRIRQRHEAFVDGFIREVLAALPVRAPAGHYWNQAAGPVIKLPEAANDNGAAVASKAA